MPERSVFQKIGDAVVDFAPGIATILAATGVGTPIAGAVGAVGALGKALGLGSNPEPEEVLKAISADPEIRLKAMIAENDFKLKQKEQEIDELRAILNDVQSARTRQIETEKVTGKKDLNLYVLAWIIVAGFFVLLAWLLEVPVPQDQSGVVFMLFGALSTGFGQVLQYFFGSSKSSADKNDQISKIRKSLA